jgi:hypothetical protein
MWKRIGFALLGSVAGVVTAQVLQILGLPASLSRIPLGLLGMLLAVWYGERKRLIAKPEELHRPTSLFGSDPRKE